MALNREKTEHICERARRALHHTERDMKPVFILYQTGDFKRAVEDLSPKLGRTQGGKKLHTFLQSLREPVGPCFAGVLYYNPPRLLSFLSAEQILAPILVNMDELDDVAEAQHRVYHQIWHALNVLEEFRSARKAQETVDYIQENMILSPKYTKFKETRSNLVADIFGAFMTEFEQNSGFIAKLAVLRAKTVTQKIPGYMIEKYPYPLVSEACQLVFEDLKPVFEDAGQLLPVAFKMAGEVANTYGDEIIQQWRDFCIPAQEMIWLDYKTESVLGNAVFTAEDPYVRTGAYLVCELLGHTAMPAAERNLYNAYAGNDKNRSIHFRACEEAFHRVLSRAAGMNDPSAFIEEVKRQNKILVQGNPVGWCAHAIIDASVVFEECLKTELTIEDVSNTFQKSLQRIEWGNILKVSRMIITMHRERQTFGLNEIASILTHLEDVEDIIKTLRTSVKSDFFEANVTNVQRHKTMQTTVNIGFGPIKNHTNKEQMA